MPEDVANPKEIRLSPGDVRFFSGRSHAALAQDITDCLNIPLEKTIFRRFSNDNLYIQLGASVRGRSVFILQSLTPPVSEHLVELLMMLDIAHGAGAHEIHAIIPYFSYARSDKKDAPRISITARLIADLLQTAGATHVMTMTLHSPQVHGFFSVPTDPLTARHLFGRYLIENGYNTKQTIVISPDVGRAKPAMRLAQQLNLPVASANKERISDHEVRIDSLLRKQVKGYRRAIIYDDEIATGSTVLTLSNQLEKSGIEDITLVCTHGLFTGNALARITRHPLIGRVVTSDTIPPPKNPPDKLKILHVGPVFAQAIWRNHTRQSIGDLYSEHYDLDEAACCADQDDEI